MIKEYDEATLKTLQDIELQILKDFVKICEGHNLKYFALWGTAIGALRHCGFIPWDDDIDVVLPREDYENFIQIAQRDYGDKYTVLNAETCEDFPLMTTRWMKKGTKFREFSAKNVHCDFGVFLDIYAFDSVSDDEKRMKRQGYITWLWSKILILRSVPFPVLGFRGAKKYIVTFICAVVHFLMSVLHIPKKWIYHKCKASSCRYNSEPTKRIGFLCGIKPFINIVSIQDLYPLQSVPFEDINIQVPKEVEKMLTMCYGDFMQLPPPDKRKNHFPLELDFGEDL